MKINKIKSLLSRRFTLMFVPHGQGAPRQINIPLSALLITVVAWTGVTFWGSYLSAQHIDYWRSELSNQVLKLKVQYLTKQIDNSRSIMDEVKQIEVKLRDFLQYKDPGSLIKEDRSKATGGPTLTDQDDLTRLLKKANPNLSWNRLVEKVSFLKTESEQRVQSYSDLNDWISLQRKKYRSIPMGWPSPGRLSSHFGRRPDPFTGLVEFHFGVDISAPAQTPIRSTADGKIRLASWQSGYGNLVVIHHEFGYSTRYAHNKRLLVKVGDNVKRGQVIALMGDTGKASGSHCHYEIWRYSKRMNPYAFLTGTHLKSGPLSKIPPPTKPRLRKS